MENTVIQLDAQLYKLDDYKDKHGNDIKFNLFFIAEKEDSHLSQLVIQSSINEEMTGYISLLYLSEKNKNTYFNTAWDFYFNQKMPTSLKQLFNNNLPDFFKEIKRSFNMDFTKIEDFTVWVSAQVDNEYKKFISFYLNKPYPEIVTVYGEKDKTYKDFSEYPFINLKRNNSSFLGQGIANALYHCACQVLKKENMHLHASNNQTLDGQRMWQQLEKNPKFLILSDNYWGSLTTDRKNILEMQRKKITV